MLERMSQGGIYDHLGGGYARYSTDAVWLVPHFEKMLYDNAQLLELLALAHAHRPDRCMPQRAAETVGWMLRDMTAERVDGRAAFAASEDADSEGEEGRFYVWTEAEVDALLGDAAAFKRAYDVTPGGNWEGHTILRRIDAARLAEEEAALARARAVLFEARASACGRDATTRCWPTGTAWPSRRWRAPPRCSASRHGSPAPGGARLHPGRDVGAGRAGAARLAAGPGDGGRADGRPGGDGAASLALFEATGETGDGWRRRSGWRTRRRRRSPTAHGGFFTTAADATDVPLARPRTAADNATPAGNGMMAEVFARLWHLTGDAAWRERCRGAAAGVYRQSGSVAAMPTLLAAADLLEEGAAVVVAGHPRDACAAAAALRAPDPAVVVLRAPRPDALPPGIRLSARRRRTVAPPRSCAGGASAACLWRIPMHWPAVCASADHQFERRAGLGPDAVERGDVSVSERPQAIGGEVRHVRLAAGIEQQQVVVAAQVDLARLASARWRHEPARCARR